MFYSASKHTSSKNFDITEQFKVSIIHENCARSHSKTEFVKGAFCKSYKLFNNYVFSHQIFLNKLLNYKLYRIFYKVCILVS